MVDVLFPQPPSCPDRVACMALPVPQFPVKASTESSWRVSTIVTPIHPQPQWIMAFCLLLTVSRIQVFSICANVHYTAALAKSVLLSMSDVQIFACSRTTSCANCKLLKSILKKALEMVVLPHTLGWCYTKR